MVKLEKLLRKVNIYQVIGIAIAFVLTIVGYLILGSSDIFYFILAIAFIIAGAPFFITLILESKTTREMESMFLEFSRNLGESVDAGTPISKSILNIKNKDYGKLNPYIEKLANQISLGIPIKTALETFARDIGSPTVTRAVTIISESEKAGGNIEDILKSVVDSVNEIETLRKERRASMYNLVVQGYIIFVIFIIIMLVMQYKVLPIASELGGEFSGTDTTDFNDELGGLTTTGDTANAEELTRPFMWLLIVQGLFAGLVIGKLSEGKVRFGIKHSFILMVLAIMGSTVTKLILG
jgi:flagellar protein FlaJ